MAAEDLLKHAAFVRALARSLLLDPHAADDVVQEAWLKALEAPPRHAGNLRGWLARVVSRQVFRRARSEARRRAHEAGPRRPAAVPPADDSAARAEAQRALAEAVAALDEPYRTVVVLRYLDGLKPGAIARRLGVPAETVRTRLKRALAMLREKLDVGHDGDRRAWALALAPWALGKWAVADALGLALRGGLAMSKPKLVAATVAVALVGVGVVLVARGSRPAPPARSTVASRPAARVAAEDPSAPGEATPPTAAEPAPATRTALVRVVERGAGKPVPWSTVRVFSGWDQVSEAVTDAAGVARPLGLEQDRAYLVDALPPGQAPQEERRPPLGRRSPLPADGELTLEIDPVRAIVWRVLDGDIPPPADGTVIRLAADPSALVTPPAQGIMRGGYLVTSGWPATTAHALAYGPEDTSATLFAASGDAEGRPFAFRRWTNLTFTLLRGDGSPAEGHAVTLLGPGGQAHARATTDREGIARMERLTGVLANLHVQAGDDGLTRYVGSIDLNRGGEVRVVHTLQPAREVEIAVGADGVLGLPEGVRVQIPGLLLLDRRDDPAAGAVRGAVDLPPGITSLHVTVDAKGYIPEDLNLPVGGAGTPVRGSVHLVRGLSLRVVMTGPPPRAGTQPETLDLLRQSPDVRHIAELSEEKALYEGLAPGHYEVRARMTGVPIADVDLAPGADPPTLTIHREGFGIVRGRVRLPRGYDPRQARVVVEEATAAWWMGARVDPRDGTFAIGVPGDRPLTIRAVCPPLSPDPVHGRKVVTTGEDGVVLRMVEGPRLRFRIPAFFAEMSEEQKNDLGWRRPDVRVVLSRGGTEVRSLVAVASKDEWVTSGFDAGRYTVWVDIPGGTPVEREVDLAEDTDLGELPQRHGSRLRVRVLVREPFHTPRIRVAALGRGSPAIVRHTSSRGEEEVLVPGLPAGSYDVTLSVYTGGPMQPNFDSREVEVDGVGDVDLTYDLRGE